MKNFSFKALFSLLVIAYVVFAPMFVFPLIKIDNEHLNRTNTVEYYGVLELWNVDTFEGGSVSRSIWLEARALEFERENIGTFVMVKNMTLEQALINLANGNKPDLISYGIGVGADILSYLVSYNGAINVRDDLLKGGKVGGSVMAMPYILGGYSLIGNENFMSKSSEDNNYDLFNNVFDFNTTYYNKPIYSVSFGANMNINPALALALNTNLVASSDSLDPKANEMDSYTAYEKYVHGSNASVLVGT